MSLAIISIATGQTDSPRWFVAGGRARFSCGVGSSVMVVPSKMNTPSEPNGWSMLKNIRNGMMIRNVPWSRQTIGTATGPWSTKDSQLSSVGHIMKPTRTIWLFFVALAVCSASTPTMAQPGGSVAGVALESIFNPRRAPEQKTMGLLQRSFLDLVESSQQALEIALVVDGTDSMASDIEAVRKSLRNMVADLRNYKGDKVSFAVVVFRDSGAPSGEASLLLNQFTNDVTLVEQAFQRLTPETGAPYFPELADLGVHEALSKLNWSDAEDVTRWLILFADAPPYDADFVDSETDSGARRRYDTDLLVDLAQREHVQISCVLCTSRQEEQAVYEQVLDRTRAFMSALATGTDGLMLDLSYPDIRAALVEAAKKQRVEHARIGQITREQVEQARQAAEQDKLVTAPTGRLRIAILPHLPLANMSFDPDEGAVQLATELRQKFQLIPRVEVSSPVDIDRALRRLRSANVPEGELLATLASRLRADYVVWGNYRSALDIVRIQTAIYSPSSETPLVEAKTVTQASYPETMLAGDLVTQLVRGASTLKRVEQLVAAVNLMPGGINSNRELIIPVANSVEARSDLLAGFEALEQALAYAIDSSEGHDLVERAAASLTKASEEDVRNPFAHLLLANCLFNQAQRAAAQGKSEQAEIAIRDFNEALKRAYRERDRAEHSFIKQEIEADYNLLVKKDYEAALQLYQQLAQVNSDSKLHAALRAHWMLAGIRSGDWNVPENLIDTKEARTHLVAILAYWPDSSEAQFIKRALRWSEEKGRNEFEHFPKENRALLTM